MAKNKAELNYFSANFDALTGIANRANIMKQIIETKELCDRNKQKFALIIFDLDKFKIMMNMDIYFRYRDFNQSSRQCYV
ncbi:MAG: diguanylate cyclase domain-containing protein [Clostridium sp.]|uniref:diguanylate cyclase domain-containing protein n=1 Tax=Clostridium sp. TaxID=1506 RepID=UPI003D6CBDB9